jgi:hypothetical protein
MRLLSVLLVVACHSPPTAPQVRLSPDAPDTRQDLVAEVQVAEGLSIGWAWYRDDVRVGDISGPRVPASLTARGQVWRVEVTVSDGRDLATATASRTIRNAPPTATVELGPAAPEAGDPLVLAALALDADGDPTRTSIRWLRDGEVVSELTGDRVPRGVIERGEIWSAEVVPSDPFEQGPAAAAVVEVVNGAPDLGEVRISPAEPRTGDPLEARVQVSDPEGDAVEVQHVWRVDGVIVQEGPAATLPAALTAKGQVVSLTVVAEDALGAAASALAAPVEVLNTPPARPAPSISPAEPVAEEALVCGVVASPPDPDGDPVTAWQVAWNVDGEPFEGTSTTVIPGDTVPAGVTFGDETWTCTVRAGDGEAFSAAGAASATVAWEGFRRAQTVAGRTLTCASVRHDETWTTCENPQVDGQGFPNGVGCATGFVDTASPHTDHADLCRLITGHADFRADYRCGVMATRVTWDGGWGSRDDNGYTAALRCAW